MKLYLLSSLFLTALLYLPNNAVFAQLNDGTLKQPNELKSSSAGDFKINLSLAEGRHNTNAVSDFRTRLLGGSLPGPTLRVKKGEMLYVNFENKLERQSGTSTSGSHHHPDSTNLHFHGAHVSGERPADDTTLSIEPGGSYQYKVEFPSDHMGGTHWLHPHRHGAGTLQVGGGAAMVLIVEDGPGEVPDEVATAEEVILMVQLFEKDDLDDAADDSGDELFRLSSNVGDEFLLVNGQYRPTLTIQTGEWQRWRVVFGGWDRDNLNFELNSAGTNASEMNLLAKDGIYITDYPRPLDLFPIATGGRADIMVRCNIPGAFWAKAETYAGGEGLFVVNVVGAAVSNNDAINIDNFFADTSKRPEYLQDLRSRTVSSGCSCGSYMDSNQFNGQSYQSGRFLHRSRLGSIVERTIDGLDSHPYHQHVYPFQLTDVDDLSSAERKYYKEGDYHDSILFPSAETAVIRYKPISFPGRMAVHCHRLKHADRGMVTAEEVVEGGTCACSSRSGGNGFMRAPSKAPTKAPTDEPTNALTPAPEQKSSASSSSSSSSSSKKEERI